MIRPLAPLAMLLSLLAGCSGGGWYGGGEEPPLPGDRVSVLQLENELTPDPSLADLKINLPSAQTNSAWPQQGGTPAHVMQHLAATEAPSLVWLAEVGEGSAEYGQLLARPVVAEGRVYAMDAFGSISAFSTETGERLWRKTNDDLGLDDSVFGGGLAYDDGRLFAIFTSGDVVSLSAANGAEIWRQALTLPLRAAPTVADGIVLVLSADNQVYALDRETGQPMWRHAGFFEAAGVLGGPSPAVDGGIAVVPYSSAEVFALRLDNGRPLWSDTLQRPRRTQALAQINDIDGTPVIAGDRVYVGGRGGQVAAIDIRRGVRAWDSDLATVDTPWVAGDFLYLLTERNEVVCLARQSGRLRWVAKLPETGDPDDADAHSLTWHGPVLAGERLIFTNSNKEAVTLSPYTGDLLERIELPGSAQVPPVVAAGTIYFLTEEAELLAYR